ncbi:hypothetical protein AB0B10_23995 [Micromonospora arborensis]|uniref:hypothetical protein n=1 Tax=Micromonospora arborensis TaxID=2116518 RepID=UPI0033E231DE
MTQPPPRPEGPLPAFPPPPDPDRTVPQQAVPQSTSADPTVPHPVGEPAPQPYAPGQAPPQYGAHPPVPPQYGVPQGTTGYPASTPPYAGPVPTPPVSGPGYGEPLSAPPVSGPGYGQPLSAPPGMAPAYGPAGAPPAGRSPAVLVLALVTALLFVVSAVMTGLFVTKNNELNRTEKRLTGQVSQRDETIAANTAEITKLRTDLQAMQEKLDNTEQDLTGTRNDRDEQARQKTVIANCLDKLTTALGAAAAGNRSAYDAAMKDLDKICNEAEDYL